MKMNNRAWVRVLLAVGVTGVGLGVSACGEEPIVPPPPAPPEYADKHMPPAYWSDPDIIEQGRQIFIGAENIDVNCASCHGKDGKPVKAGARDFRRTEQMKLYSDSVWFWRVSEGVKGTKMKPWKTKLSEDERWKVIAFERTFALKGMEYDPVKAAWIPVGTAGEAPAKEAPEVTEGGSPEGGTPKGGTPEGSEAQSPE